MYLENSMVRRDVRSYEWDRFDNEEDVEEEEDEEEDED